VNGCRSRGVRIYRIRILTDNLIDNRSKLNIIYTSDHKKMKNKKTIDIVFHRSESRIFVFSMWWHRFRAIVLYRVVDQVWVTSESESCPLSLLRSCSGNENGEDNRLYLPDMAEDRTNNVTNSTTKMNCYFIPEYDDWEYV